MCHVNSLYGSVYTRIQLLTEKSHQRLEYFSTILYAIICLLLITIYNIIIFNV